MRFSVSLLALMCASPVLAEDFLVRADVAEAVVYNGIAEVVRRVELDLPAGEHRVIYPTWTFDRDLPPIVRTSSGEIGEIVALRDFPFEDGQLDTPEQASARSAVEDAEAARDAARAALEEAGGALRAAELQQAYLQMIVRGGEDGVTMPEDATTLAGILGTLGTEMARTQDAIHAARQDQSRLQRLLETAQETLNAAEEALDALEPWRGHEPQFWSISIDLEEALSVTLEIDDFEEAFWVPTYDVHLDSETGELEIDRHIALQAYGWRNVDVILSTADPSRGRAPSPAWPHRAGIHEQVAALSRTTGLFESETMDAAPAAPMVEPVVIVEDSAAIAPIAEGLSLVYPYPETVSVGTDGIVFLPFGGLELQADLINRAVPRRDDTAYLIADLENTSGEPVLPGEARFFRDGALIGEGYLEFAAAGAEFELPFGPLDHIQLSWTDLSRDTGDRGVFVSSDTEERRVMVTAENLSGEPVELELLYATPFSEQEDLEIEVSTTLSPDDTAWEDRRGVYAWELSLDPGQEMQIRMDFAFSWPDGQILDWRP